MSGTVASSDRIALLLATISETRLSPAAIAVSLAGGAVPLSAAGDARTFCPRAALGAARGRVRPIEGGELGPSLLPQRVDPVGQHGEVGLDRVETRGHL